MAVFLATNLFYSVVHHLLHTHEYERHFLKRGYGEKYKYGVGRFSLVLCKRFAPPTLTIHFENFISNFISRRHYVFMNAAKFFSFSGTTGQISAHNTLFFFHV